MHLVICDPESHSGLIKRCVARYLEECCADFNIQTYHSTSELLSNSEDILYSDLIIVGDGIAGVRGFKVVTELRSISPQARIAVVTDSAELAFTGYRHNIFRCVRRSRMRTDFEECLNALLFSRGLYDICDRVRSGNSVKRIRISKIVYYESRNRKIFIIAESGVTYLREPYKTVLDRIESFLAGFDFIRIHQSFLVNMLYIDRFYYDHVEIRGGITLPVSHLRARSSREIYEKHLRELR